jgi:hypothetical protein
VIGLRSTRRPDTANSRDLTGITRQNPAFPDARRRRYRLGYSDTARVAFCAPNLWRGRAHQGNLGG